MKSTAELYNRVILTAIALLLAAILWRMPTKMLTVADAQKAGAAKPYSTDWANSIPLIYVQSGNIRVEDFEIPLPVEVQNEVQITGKVEVDR